MECDSSVPLAFLVFLRDEHGSSAIFHATIDPFGPLEGETASSISSLAPGSTTEVVTEWN